MRKNDYNLVWAGIALTLGLWILIWGLQQKTSFFPITPAEYQDLEKGKKALLKMQPEKTIFTPQLVRGNRRFNKDHLLTNLKPLSNVPKSWELKFEGCGFGKEKFYPDDKVIFIGHCTPNGLQPRAMEINPEHSSPCFVQRIELDIKGKNQTRIWLIDKKGEDCGWGYPAELRKIENAHKN